MEDKKQYFSWYEIARREIGVKELRGIADNPRIVTYHASTTLRATDDEVPWCSSYVNWVMKTAGYPYTKSAAAKSWLNYGTKIDAPVQGCLVVLTRMGGNHVGFYDGTTNGLIRILGGNQDDAVNIKGFYPYRVLAFVLPHPLKPADAQLLTSLQKGA